jgi:RimJ/RimL family protein N-acetyltransferase
MDVRLLPFTEAALPVVQPWFRHPEVDRRLGGPEWPARELRLMAEKPGGDFRGRRVLRTHSWLVLDADEVPVAKVGGDVYDRWTWYVGETPEGPIIDGWEPGPAMGLAYVVEPGRWGRGFGTAALRAVTSSPEVADVRLFVAGIDADNTASSRCARSAGLVPDDLEPDWEGTVHHILRRPADSSMDQGASLRQPPPVGSQGRPGARVAGPCGTGRSSGTRRRTQAGEADE